MNADSLALASSFVSESYVTQGQQALSQRHKQVKALLSSRRLPEKGWDDASIERFIQDLALMDSNNFLDNIGMGEREARVASQLVAQRHYRMAHGIGRSGDVGAEQPKAAGSSLLAKLTNLLAADAMAVAGLQDLGPVTVLPLATGMAITMTLLALRSSRPEGAKFIIWSRIDQKTCLKAITAACLVPHVLGLKLEGDELKTDVEGIHDAIRQLGEDNIACVVTTTSCFAPRASDDVVAVAKLCATANVPHIINNAYGVQSAAICQQITSACRKGRVDAIIQSTDKNFMVPVGGAIIAASRKLPGLVDAVHKVYPGRAAVNAHLDLLITLLHWGAEGWRQVLQQREELYPYLRSKLAEVAAQHGERLLETPGNPISVAVTLDSLGQDNITFFGSMLWTRCISGTRVVAPGKKQAVAGIDFIGYGSHYDAYPHAYLTGAAAIGTTRADVDQFCARLSKCFAGYHIKTQSSAATAAKATEQTT